MKLQLGFLVGILGFARLPALLLPVTNILARTATALFNSGSMVNLAKLARKVKISNRK